MLEAAGPVKVSKELGELDRVTSFRGKGLAIGESRFPRPRISALPIWTSWPLLSGVFLDGGQGTLFRETVVG